VVAGLVRRTLDGAEVLSGDEAVVHV
jgi:hypothetical protein